MTTYIGIDVSKHSLDTYISEMKEATSFANNIKGITKLIKYLKNVCKNINCITCEATGGYERLLIQELQKARMPVHVAHANKIRYFAKASGELAKTDSIDAKIICLYAQHFKLKAKVVNITPEQEYLKGLAVRRSQLISEKVREQNRLEIPLPDCLNNSIKKHIKWLEQELEQIGLLIDEYIISSQEFTKRVELMTSIPGIGKQTAIAFITDVPELGKIDTSALAALIGVAPFASDSGTIRKQRKIYGGRTNVRQILYMATVASLRVNHFIKSFYTKLINRGKKAKVAIVACMRKLLSILNSVVKRQSAWSDVFI